MLTGIEQIKPSIVL